MLIHLRQREGQESWENMMYKAYCINSITLKIEGETQRTSIDDQKISENILKDT